LFEHAEHGAPAKLRVDSVKDPVRRQVRPFRCGMFIVTVRQTMSKRPDGSLENEVMSVLWSSDDALSPADVRDRLASPLAYTSVATVLGRLHTKGLVTKRDAGRAFVYQAAFDESQMMARRIAEVLEVASDRRAALTGFVSALSKKDAVVLKSLLAELER
jgi:predicted transcriptional regulator